MTQEAENPITTELVKANVTDAILQQIKRDYLPLKINGIDDKDGYKQVHDARMTCVKLRTTTEKICKRGREDAVRIQKEWIAKEKEIIGKVQEVELHLKKQEDAIDAEKEAIKIRQERLLKLPGRKEQVVGIESYFAIELNDEVIMSFDDPSWNNLVLMAKDKKITEFEEKERLKKDRELQEIFASRTNELIATGARKKANGIWMKADYFITEEAIIGLSAEYWTAELDKFKALPDEIKPAGSVYVPDPHRPSQPYTTVESEVKSELSDEENLFRYASQLENLAPPTMKTEAGKKVLAEAMELITKAIWILRQ